MTPFEAFRAAVLEDSAAQQALAAEASLERFTAAAVAFAGQKGIALDPADLQGIASPIMGGVPQLQWLPVAVNEAGVHWLHFAGAPLAEPFFAESAERAALRPFNRLFGWRTPLEALERTAPADRLAPTGFIFHMSRCGSTLVSQMLAALDTHIVVAEAEPIDAMVQLAPDALRAMIETYGRNRSGKASRYFVKLDSWHALALPLFRRAFPEVPWVFLYRDPVEVLVSHARRPGRQTTPGALPAELVGTTGEGVHPIYYAGQVLSRICESALDHSEGGIFVNYRNLPDALFDRILPHFGIKPKRAEKIEMALPAMRDAKAPKQLFLGDSDAKQAAAPPELRACADHFLGAVYRRLETASGA